MENNIETQGTSKLTAQISKILDEYFEKYGTSARYLGESASVYRKYIKRLHNQEIPEDKICPKKLYKTLSKVAPDSVHRIIGAREDWIDIVSRWKVMDRKTFDRSVSNEELESIIMEDDFTTIAFIIASDARGVNEDYLVEVGGFLLVNAANKLVENKILKIENGFYVSAIFENSSNTFAWSNSKVGQVIKAVNNYFDSTHSGQNRNYRFLLTLTGNKKCVRNMYDRIDNFCKELSEECRRPENQGNIPIFFNTTMDTFTDKLDDGTEVLQ